MRSRLVLVVLLSVSLMLAGCGKKTPEAADPGVVTTLSPGASGLPAPSAAPTGEPDDDPDDGPGDEQPSASLPSKTGYVWVSKTADTYLVNSPYHRNSELGVTKVTHLGVGRYQVSFGSLGGPGGVAHAQAYGSGANFCVVNSWSAVGVTEVLDISCYAANGTLQNSQFVASYAVGSQDNARFSYLWADKWTEAGPYHPSVYYRYDSVDSDAVAVQRLNKGRYEVYLPAAGPLSGQSWTFQITAYASASICKLAGFSEAGKRAQVTCRNAGGSYVDTQFSLTFASGASFVGRTDREYGHFSEASAGLETPGTGSYVVRGTDLGQARGQVVALARGSSATYCNVGGWNPSGADLRMAIRCFNPGGAAANSDFEVSVTW